MVNPPGRVAEWQLSHQVIPKLPVRFRPQSSHTPNPPYLSSTIRKYAAVTNSTIRPNKIRLAPLGHLQGPQHREIPCRGDAPRGDSARECFECILRGQHCLALERDREIAKPVPALVILDQDVSINLGEVTLDAFDDPVDVAQVALTERLSFLASCCARRWSFGSSPILCSRASTALGLVRANGGFPSLAPQPGAFCPEGAAGLWVLRRRLPRVQIALQLLRQRQA